jgi:hypothetical protein
MKVEILWFVGLLALFILAWKPLHHRFQGWAVLCAYLFFAFAMVAPIFEPHGRDTWKAFFVWMAVAALVLLANRQKPIEERSPIVAWMVVHGLWDQLAEVGISADEIERLKKLTPEELARLPTPFPLMASAELARLMTPLIASAELARMGVLQKKVADDPDYWCPGGPDDYYSSMSPYRTRDHWTISGSHYD